jgi:hypothetical protein
MALSKRQKDALKVALCDDKRAAQIIAILEQDSLQAVHVAPLGTIAALTAISGSYADLAAANTSVTALRAEVQARLAAIEAKVDAILAAQVTAKQMV